jgi:hypothetical protein
MTQSRLHAIRSVSPASFVRAKAVVAWRSTPSAEMWMSRRTPARSQAANSAAMPSLCTPVVESRRPSCSTPAQLTTASTARRCGNQSAGSRARAMSIVTAVACRGLSCGCCRRVAATTWWRSASRRAVTDDPINPLAPRTSTRMGRLILCNEEMGPLARYPKQYNHPGCHASPAPRWRLRPAGGWFARARRAGRAPVPSR